MADARRQHTRRFAANGAPFRLFSYHTESIAIKNVMILSVRPSAPDRPSYLHNYHSHVQLCAKMEPELVRPCPRLTPRGPIQLSAEAVLDLRKS